MMTFLGVLLFVLLATGAWFVRTKHPALQPEVLLPCPLGDHYEEDGMCLLLEDADGNIISETHSNSMVVAPLSISHGERLYVLTSKRGGRHIYQVPHA